MNSNEKRYCEELETRSENGEMRVKGYAIVFNKPSKLINGNFVEVIEKRSLEGVDLSDTFLLYNHNTNDVLGNTRSGTLSLNVDEKGLHFESILPNTELGKNTFELIKRGDIRGVSFGFIVSRDVWNTKVRPEQRTIKQFKAVREISITPIPAYDDTEVSTRALEFIGVCRDCRNDLETLKYANEAKSILKGLKDEK